MAKQTKADVIITAKDLTGPGIKSATVKLQSMGKTFSSIGRKMSLFVTTPLAILGGIALKTAANFEKQQVAFETMLGSAEKAKVLLKDIVDFSAKTPFQLPGLATAATRLLGFGIEADKVVDTLRNLGNVAQGDQARLDRLTLAFGKLKAKGKATLEELNMFLEAGVPILDELAGMYDTTTQEMFKMINEGKIGFEDVNQAIINLSTGTGMFAGMLEKQSQTLGGMLSTLKDNFSLLGMEIMQTVMPQIKKFTEKVMKLVEWFRDLDERTKKIIITIVGIAAAIGPVLLIIGQAVKVIGFLKIAFAALNVVMSANPILAVVAAVAALVVIGILVYKNWDKVSRFLIEAWNKLKEIALKVFTGIKLAVLKSFEAILIGIKKIADIFMPKMGEKIGNVLDRLEEKIENTKNILDELPSVFDRTARELRKMKEDAEKVKEEIEELNNELVKKKNNLIDEIEMSTALIIQLQYLQILREANYVAVDKETESNTALIIQLQHLQILRRENYKAIEDETGAMGDYYTAMQRVREEAELLSQKQVAVKESIDRVKEAKEQEMLVFASSISSMQIYGETLKGFVGNVISLLLRGLGEQLIASAALALIPGPSFNPFIAGATFAAGLAAIAASQALASMEQGGITKKEGLYYLHRDEIVAPLNKGGAGTTINVYVQGSIKTEKDITEAIIYAAKREGYI